MPFVAGTFRRPAGLAAAFFADTFLGDADFREADFFLLAGFLAAFFLAGLDFGFFLLAGFLAGAFLVTFFLEAFFVADFRADFLAADFFGAAVLFFDAFLFDDFLLLTLRFLPVVFLLAGGLRDAAFFLLAAARFRFLLAVFFAGIFDSCRSGKNAELYIACANMEAQYQGNFGLPGSWPQPSVCGMDKNFFRCICHCRKRPADGLLSGFVSEQRQSFYPANYITLARFHGRTA